MTAPKKLQFNADQIAMANFAASLSHPARVAIVTFLQDKEKASCNEIVEAMPLAQATVSQHLKTLLDAGLILQFPEGPKMFYQLDCKTIKSFCNQFQCTLGTQPSEPSN